MKSLRRNSTNNVCKNLNKPLNMDNLTSNNFAM